MSAEDDLCKLLDLARAAVACSHNGADFSTAYKAQCDWHEAIQQKCTDPAYQAEHNAAVARLMPHYRRSDERPATTRPDRSQRPGP